MGKGAKKRRAARKKQEKALNDAQLSCPLENTESCPLEENNEEDFSPKAPVQANEGGDKDRTFDIVGGSASPFSHTARKEVGISDGNGYKNGENAEFQEFSAFRRLEVGNSESSKYVLERNGLPLVLSKGVGLNPPVQSRDWDVFRNIDDTHANLQLSTEEGDEGNAVSFDQCEADLMEASKRSELEIRDNNNNSVECMDNENGTIQDIVINGFSLSQTDNVTPTQKLRDTSEGFPLIPSQGLESFNSYVDREPAKPDEDGVDRLSEQQNGHGKDTIIHNSELGPFEGNSLKYEIGYADGGLLEDAPYEKRSIEHSMERLVSHKSLVSKVDDPIPSERLATEAEKIESPTSFDESYPLSAFEGVPGSSSPRKLECNTILGGEEGLGLAQRQSENVKDVSMDVLGQDDAEASKQVKDELWDFNRFTQSTNESIEKSATHESNANQAHNISLSERLEIGMSIQGGFENLQEHNRCEKETNLDNSESKIFEMLQSVDSHKTDHPKGVCMNSSQTLNDTKNPEQMGSTIAIELEEPQLLYEECKDRQDLCLVGSEHVCVEVNNQPNNANARNTNIQEAGTNMLKEEHPFFNRLVVPIPVVETEPSVKTSHFLVTVDMGCNKSSGVVLLDNEVTLKGKVNDDNGSNLRYINDEPDQHIHFLKLNGEEKDAHLENTLPVALHRKGEATDMFPQSNEKVGRKLGFWGVLEFFLCWRD